ncbi:MAG: prefoldin subunit [Candidatus Poseidonia sp.]|nr:prefoldin subunit [Poseidonia sp.]
MGEQMEHLEQLQMVVAEVQAARQQVSSVRAQVQELEGTVEAVKNQPDDLSLHRQLGGVLIEVSDRDALVAELTETLAALRAHLERFAEREKQLVQTYDELKLSLQGAQE